MKNPITQLARPGAVRAAVPKPLNQSRPWKGQAASAGGSVWRTGMLAMFMSIVAAAWLEAAQGPLFHEFFPRYPVGDVLAHNPEDNTEGPKVLTSADLNRDGRADVIVGNLDGSLSVLLGQADGTLSSQILMPATGLLTNSSLRGIAVADFNRDGHLDVVAGDISRDGIVLMLGDSTGVLRPVSRTQVGPVRALAAADFNDDQNADLLVACGPPDCEECGASKTDGHANRFACIILGNGDGTFQSATNLLNPGAPTCFYDVAAADLDLDGRLEALILDNVTYYSKGEPVGWQKRILVFHREPASWFPADQPRLILEVAGQGPRSMCLVNLDERIGGGAPAPTNPAPDIVVANRDSASLEVFPNLGAMRFGAPVGFSAGDAPRDVAAADLDGDGYMDLVVVNRNINAIGVLRNEGNLRLTPLPVEYPTGVSPRQVVLADFNGDGALDAAVNNRISEDVSLFLGQRGLAGFLLPDGYYPSGFAPVSLVAADFNEDGLEDVATANVRSHDVQVRLNLGDGNLGTAMAMGVNFEPAFLAVADLNSDGHVDLVVSCLGSHLADSQGTRGAILALLGVGDGTFRPAVVTPMAGLITRPYWLRLGDLSGDGILDAAVTGINGALMVFRGLGNGAFAAGLPIGLWPDGRPLGVALADFDRDGLLDIACSRGKVFLNDGQFFDPAKAVKRGDLGWDGRVKLFNSGFQAWAVEAEDLDEDGICDLIVALTFVRPDPIGVYFGNGDGTFTEPDIYEGPDVGAVALVGTDMNGDGIKDIVVGNRCAASVIIMAGTGNRKFALQEIVHTPSVEDVVVADFNRDGQPDLAGVGIGLWRLLSGIEPLYQVPNPAQQIGLPERGGLLINEIMAANENYKILHGASPDWVEIYNHSSAPQSLAGWTLATVPADGQPAMWPFPANLTIPAFGRQVVYCKKRFAAPAEIVADLELSADGETLILFGPGLVEIDRVRFPAIPTDTTYGRFRDGARFFCYNPAPSLGQPNMRPGNMPPVIERKQPFVGAGASGLAISARVFDDVAVAYAAVCYRVVETGIGFIEIPLNDDGQSGDKQAGDGYFGAQMPDLAPGSTLEYYLRTADLEGQSDFSPNSWRDPATRHRLTVPVPSATIRLAELVADNRTGLSDEQWQLEDWIELYNASSQPVSLAGLALTLDCFDPLPAWPLPAGRTLSPGERLVIFCDADPSAGSLHASFTLSRQGERVYLVRTNDWVVIDSLCYDAVPADTSFGVVGNGTQAQLLAWATPGAENLGWPDAQGVAPIAPRVIARLLAPAPYLPKRFSLRWQGDEQRQYRIESSDDLRVWKPGPAAVNLGYGYFEGLDLSPASDLRYYRVIREP